jgi:hypothetical protein
MTALFVISLVFAILFFLVSTTIYYIAKEVLEE